MHYRMVSSIPGLYPGVSGISPHCWQPEMSPGERLKVSWELKSPLVKNQGLQKGFFCVYACVPKPGNRKDLMAKESLKAVRINQDLEADGLGVSSGTATCLRQVIAPL